MALNGWCLPTQPHQCTQPKRCIKNTSHITILRCPLSHGGAMPLNCLRYYTNIASASTVPRNRPIIQIKCFCYFLRCHKNAIQMPAKTHLIVSAWLRKLRFNVILKRAIENFSPSHFAKSVHTHILCWCASDRSLARSLSVAHFQNLFLSFFFIHSFAAFFS